MKNEEIQKMAKHEGGYWWFVGRRKIVSEFIKQKFGSKTDLKILDVGCGTGNTTISLKKFGDVYGIEQSFLGLQQCCKLGLTKIVNGDLNNLPFSSNKFDLITMLDVLEHIENDLEILQNLRNLLKKDGMILITVPAYQFLWSEHDVALSHFRRYNSQSLSNVLEKASFSITRMSFFITILFPLIFLYRKFSKSNNNNAQSQLVNFPNSVDKLLQKIILFESKLIRKINFPFGLSIICFAKK